MAIWLTENSKIIVQGITGSEGLKHSRRMHRAGAKVVGGVNARKAGTAVDLDGESRPVFGTVAEDSAVFWAHAVATGNKTRIIGPNCPGLASPGKSNAGIIPADITTPGRIGLVSKSGTLTYQMMYELRDIGFSSCIGIGGDPIIGTTHIDALQAFQDDPETDAIVMIGEIGGDAEERAAAYIEQHITKPVVGYVAGFTAPEGKTMGHAGAIVSGSAGTAQAKKEALEKVGVRVGKTPSETARLMRDVMKGLG